MAFDQSSITEVSVDANGPDLFVRWRSTRPSGSWFQVYVNGILVWSGQARQCHLPRPQASPSELAWVEVGAVDPDEIHRSFAGSLASASLAGRIELSWEGGTYLDPRGQDDVAGFRITRSRAPGLPNDPTNIVAVVTAYPGGWISDGFGLGGFGRGGFGRAATLYSWGSRPLASGVWEFSVVPIDHQGNARAAARTVTVPVQAVPQAPARPRGGQRLSYEPSTAGPSRFTLRWLASPSDTGTH